MAGAYIAANATMAASKMYDALGITGAARHMEGLMPKSTSMLLHVDPPRRGGRVLRGRADQGDIQVRTEAQSRGSKQTEAQSRGSKQIEVQSSTEASCAHRSVARASRSQYAATRPRSPSSTSPATSDPSTPSSFGESTPRKIQRPSSE